MPNAAAVFCIHCILRRLMRFPVSGYDMNFRLRAVYSPEVWRTNARTSAVQGLKITHTSHLLILDQYDSRYGKRLSDIWGLSPLVGVCGSTRTRGYGGSFPFPT